MHGPWGPACAARRRASDDTSPESPESRSASRRLLRREGWRLRMPELGRLELMQPLFSVADQYFHDVPQLRDLAVVQRAEHAVVRASSQGPELVHESPAQGREGQQDAAAVRLVVALLDQALADKLAHFARDELAPDLQLRRDVAPLGLLDIEDPRHHHELSRLDADVSREMLLVRRHHIAEAQEPVQELAKRAVGALVHQLLDGGGGRLAAGRGPAPAAVAFAEGLDICIFATYLWLAMCSAATYLGSMQSNTGGVTMKVCRSVKTVIRRALPAMASLALLIPGAAIAQYPAKPVHLIVPFPAGGATDAAARELAEGLSHALGQTFVVDNRPGADGAIAAQAVVSANPDGYTLLFASSSMEGIPFVQKNAPFKTLNDLAPVSLVCRFVFGVAVNAGLPSRSMDEFVAYARANPGKLNYGSISLSEVMAAAQFMKATGTHLVKVGYKGAPQLVPDLAGNQIQVSFGAPL